VLWALAVSAAVGCTNSAVLLNPVDLQEDRISAARGIVDAALFRLRCCFCSVEVLVRERRAEFAKDVELMPPRPQLSGLARQHPRPRLRPADRALIVARARLDSLLTMCARFTFR
jgi:hypothetical protein